MRAKCKDKDDEYIPLLARALFQVAQTQVFEDDAGNVMSAKMCFARAHELRKRVVPDETRFPRELEEVDYDMEVVIWAR